MKKLIDKTTALYSKQTRDKINRTNSISPICNNKAKYLEDNDNYLHLKISKDSKLREKKLSCDLLFAMKTNLRTCMRLHLQ